MNTIMQVWTPNDFANLKKAAELGEIDLVINSWDDLHRSAVGEGTVMALMVKGNLNSHQKSTGGALQQAAT